MLLIFSLVLVCVAIGLTIGLVHQNESRVKMQRHLQEAIFKSWVRETEIQCRKSAYVHKRVSPIVTSLETNSIKQILISNPATDTEPVVLLAAININFARIGREVNIGCSHVVEFNPSERWSINGDEWSPITMIKGDLWKYFKDDPENESTYDFRPDSSSIATHA